MADLPKVLVFGAPQGRLAPVVQGLREHCEIISAPTLVEALAALRETRLQGVCVMNPDISPASFLLESGGILEKVPDGVVLLDLESRILWCNTPMLLFTGRDESPLGMKFFDAFGAPEILGPDFGPFHTAIGSGCSAYTTIRIAEKTYLEIEATPVMEGKQSFPSYLLVMVRDQSKEIIQREKLNSIYQAGLELGDLQPQEVLEMTTEDRVELLKSKILHYTQDLLEFETVEVRLFDQDTQELRPLLSVGMQPIAEGRKLFARAEGNGVTGFVAATGRSYLCEDTTQDPLYLPGAFGARSSLTVPLVLHEEILGTFNVESPRPGAFSDSDLQFLELFCREVAIALNTLDLLVAQKATTAQSSTLHMLREVASPVDEILNDAAWVLEKYVEQEPAVAERLRRVLNHTREIRELIQKVGQTISPELKRPGFSRHAERQALRAKRILVADSDRDVRRAAHELLGRVGCIVETAHDGEEALLMARTFQ